MELPVPPDAVARLFRGGDFPDDAATTLASKEASYSTRSIRDGGKKRAGGVVVEADGHQGVGLDDAEAVVEAPAE